MRLAIASGALTSVIVGASVPVTGLLQGYPLLTGQAMRYALGGLVLLAWTLLRGQRLPLPAWGDMPALLGLVATGMRRWPVRRRSRCSRSGSCAGWAG